MRVSKDRFDRAMIYREYRQRSIWRTARENEQAFKAQQQKA
jgi:hypothetical protein